jgi:hypothetical protein
METSQSYILKTISLSKSSLVHVSERVLNKMHPVIMDKTRRISRCTFSFMH